MITLGKMVEILGLLIIGFFVRKWNLLPDQTPRVLSGLSAKLFLPCLLVYINIEKCTVQNLRDNAQLVWYGALFAAISVALGYLLAPIFERKDAVIKRQYRYSVAVPNTGAAAIPLSMALFGVEGVFQQGLYAFVLTIVIYSWGVMQLTPQSKSGFFGTLKRFFNPVMISMVVGMALVC